MKKVQAQRLYQTTNKLREHIEFDKKITSNLNVLDRISTEESYHFEDICIIAKYGINWDGYNFDKQLRIIRGIVHLTTFLKQLLNEDSDIIIAVPIFIIYNNGDYKEDNWITLCIIKNQDIIIVLHKDSLATEISSEVKQIFRTSFSKHTIDFKNNFATGQKKVQNTSLMCLKNTEIIKEGVENNVIDFIRDFEQKTFYSEDELINAKEIFEIKLLKNTLLMATHYLGKDKEFKDTLKEFIDECVKCKEPNRKFQNYIKIIEEEIQKKENNLNYEINETLIKKTNESLLTDPYIKEKFKIENTTVNYAVKNNQIVYKLNLSENFPIQCRIFSKMFSNQLKRNIKNKEIMDTVELSSSHLGLDYNKFKQFFDINNTSKEITQNYNTRIIKPINIEKIKQCQLKELSKVELKSLDQLLAECVLGMDSPSNSSPESDVKDIKKLSKEDLQDHYKQQYENKESILELKEQFEKIKEFYHKWSNGDIVTIYKWAADIKGKLKQEELYEAIAVLNKANALVTGFELRDTQILSLLIFLSSKDDHGQLCQIQTGEGKTTIVSLLTTLKVLQGQRVDIITSNQILAAEGVKDRKNFYRVFGISVTTNNIGDHQQFSEGPRDCYSDDIVYGCISNFQFDYLRDSFEGAQTRSNREFGVVILDEVDSMLVDNGGYIAKLAEPFPGTYSLKYVYLKIWQELYRAEQELGVNFENKLQNKKKELETENFKDEIKQQKYELYFTNQIEKQLDVLKLKIRASNPANIDLIPHHLKNYVENMVDKWIDNAIYAKYQCKQNEQYIITQKEGEDVIVPVDYQNTGVTLTNTLWSNGLHQFLQLKHNLHVTSETLTSSYISNVGYIKLYNNKIFGLTGTLGSTAEQELVSSIYNVNFAKIPTHRPKNFEEFECLVVSDENWTNLIALDSIIFAIQGRSVLIMCNTIKELHELAENIGILKRIECFEKIKIKTIFDENSSAVAGEEIGTCEIILATNIAGRGTDFRTSPELNNNGGLHVSVTFLPVNQRVEDQAFGRTSRQGNSGTAQLIIRKSELINLDMDITQKISFGTVKNCRDRREKARLEDIKNNKLQELHFKDAMFDKFSKLYVKFNEIKNDDPSKLYLIKDVKEYWSFWLRKRDFKRNDLKVSEEFQQFEKEAEDILGNMRDGGYLGNKIIFNPYYSIQQADYFLFNDNIIDAEKSLRHAITLNGNNSNLLYSAYMKLFEIAIEKGRSVLKRYERYIKQLIGINLRKNVETDKLYKNKAVEALEKAIKGFEKEINYIRNSFFFKNINEDFAAILIPCENNHLLTQMKSRLVVLEIFSNNAKSLLEQVNKSLENEKDVAIIARVSENLLKIDDLSTLNRHNLDSALKDLKMIGQDTIYGLKEIHEVNEIVFTFAKCHIVTGISLLACTAIFPPSAPFVTSVGCTLISEGIFDIFIHILNEGDTEFIESAYIKCKLIFYANMLITMAIPTLLNSTKILERAMKASSKLTSVLKYYKHFKLICEKLGVDLDNLSKYNKELKYVTEYNQLNELAKLNHLRKLQSTNETKFELLGGIEALIRLDSSKELSKLSNIQILLTCSKNTENAAILGAVGTIATEKLLKKNFVKLLQEIKPEMQIQVKEIINKQIGKNLLAQIESDGVNTIVNELMTDTRGRISSNIVKKIVYDVLNKCNNWKVNIDKTVINPSIFNLQIIKYTKVFCDKFKKDINTLNKPDEIQNSDEIINKLLDSIVEKITDNIYDEMMKIANTFGVNICTEFKEFSVKNQKNIQNISIIYEHYQTLGEEFGAAINNIETVYRNSALSYCTTESNTNPEDYVKFAKVKEACDSLIEFKSSIEETTEASNFTNICDLLKKTSMILKNDEIKELYLYLFKTLKGGIFTQYKKHIRNYTLDGIYPSGKIPIKTDISLKNILVNFHNVLIVALEDYKKTKSKSIPSDSENIFMSAFGIDEDKTEMILGIVHVKFTDGSELKRVTVSGDRKFYINERIVSIEGNCMTPHISEPQIFDYQHNGYRFVDTGKPEGNIYNVHNRKEINMEYTSSCAAQKLFFGLGVHMKDNPHLKIDGEVLMAETMFIKTDDVPIEVDQIKLEEPCKFCKEILPIITGLKRK